MVKQENHRQWNQEKGGEAHTDSKASDDQWDLFAAQLEGGREEAVKQLNVNLH